MRYHQFIFCGVIFNLFSGMCSAQPDERQGQVLVLKNERTLIGDIHRVGKQYEIRGSLGKSWIPADRALTLCANLKEAYQFLRSRANLNDPDERLRLARWCFLQELYPEAIKEIGEAVRLRPEHTESQRLLKYFQMSARSAKQKKKDTSTASTKPKSPGPLKEQKTPIVMLQGESMAHFTSRIQPLLMNACVRCHSHQHQVTFQLKRIYNRNVLTASTTQRNLAAVLSQLDPDDPKKSNLLLKAIQPHGGSRRAPLTQNQQEAFASLQQWVTTTLEKHPELKQHMSSVKPIKPALPTLPNTEKSGSSQAIKQLPTTTQIGFGAQRTTQKNEKSTDARTVPTTPSLTPTVNIKPKDDYDPILFNQMNHPDEFKKRLSDKKKK